MSTINYGLEEDEIINISILSEAMFVAAIFFTIAIFHYSKKYMNSNTLYFNCFYKLLSIFIVLMTFFLIVSSVSYENTINNIHIGMLFVFISLMAIIVLSNVIGKLHEISFYHDIFRLIASFFFLC